MGDLLAGRDLQGLGIAWYCDEIGTGSEVHFSVNESSAGDAVTSVHCTECPVRRLALFQPLDPAEVAVAETFRTGYRRLKPGASIFRQGEDIKEVYTLHEGWAFLYQNLVDGGRQMQSKVPDTKKWPVI